MNLLASIRRQSAITTQQGGDKMYRLGTIVIAAAAVLAACGGGGGGDDKKPTNDTPVSDGGASTSGGGSGSGSAGGEASSSTEVPALVNVRPTPDIVTDSMSYAASLGASGRSVPSQAQFNLGISEVGSSYELDFRSGSFLGDRYFSDLVLPATKLRLSPSSRNGNALQGLRVTQYEGSVATAGATAYAASVQVLTEAGIGTVGIGQWKYLGDQQYGYWSGKRHVRGAFMFGTPATALQVAAMQSGGFAGYMQAGAEAYYIDIFDQVTANASAYYDAATKTVTVRLSQLNYWNSSFGTDGRMNIQWGAPRASSLLLEDLSCSGAVSTTDGTFSCRFRSVLSGQVKGRVFGPQGQILAGTFSLSGWLVTPGSDGLVGSFIVQRPTGSSPAVTPGQTPWTATPGNIVMNEYPAVSAPMTVVVQAPSSQARPVYAAVLDASGTVNPDVRLTQNGQQYEVVFYTIPTFRADVRSGEVVLRLCHDDPLVCREPVAGSPWRIPYRLNGQPYPGPNPQISALNGVVFEGQPLVLTPTVSLNEPAVVPGNQWEQYKFKITDAGIFTASASEGTWYPKEPSGFYNPGIGFTLKTGLAPGLYTGTVKLSVCGYSWGSTECLPVERSSVEIPYQVRVNGWTDLRTLRTLPETQALVNRRGNAQERMNLPVTVDPSNISVRWKTPFIGNYGAYGLGEGFVFGYNYRGNVNGRDWQRLEVLRESDGQPLWSADFTDTLSNESVYGSNFRVMASNSRVFARIGRTNSGSFTLKVFEALTGRLTGERQCVNCSLYWEHTYGHGWAGQTYNAGTQELQLLLYDARTDEFIAMPARRAFSSELTDAEVAKIREVFFAGQALPTYAVHPDGSAASTNNLDILAGDQGVSIKDKASGATVWSTTYPGTIIGISNSGVLYLQLKLGQTIDQWPLVAVNLMKW